MKYATSGAFRVALERRLLTASEQTKVPVVRLRKMVVFDRLLARLLIVAPDRWFLKGALALDLRLGMRARTTKDMDLTRQDNVAAATEDFLAAQAIDLGDYFTYAIEKAGKSGVVPEDVAVRYHVDTELAGRPFEGVIVDIGFSDPLIANPEILPGSDLLGFAGIEPISVPAVPLIQHIAEKVHAYTRIYPGQRPSSRVKDLIDLVLIQSSSGLQAGPLSEALHTTFLHRDTHRLPETLPAPPPAWRISYRKLAREVGLDPDLQIGYQLVAEFLNPVLNGTTPADSNWDPYSAGWS